MRTHNALLEIYRTTHPTGGLSPAGSMWGYFVVPHGREVLRVISSGSENEFGWEHVSVSLAHRIPTWEEMCLVKQLFWKDEETVLQFHPKRSRYVNRHEHVLHLWKRTGVDHELPPQECV